MKKMSEDEELMHEWVSACAIQLADTIEGLVMVSYDYIEQAENPEKLKRAMLVALECRVLDLAARARGSASLPRTRPARHPATSSATSRTTS